MNVGNFNPEQSYQQFMQLMVSQIQYQDPLNPVSQESTTAQLSQISTVSGINELNLQFSELLQMRTVFEGAQLAGRQIEYKSPTTGESRTGEVSEARINGGQLSLTVNEEQISLSDVVAVVASSQAG